MTNPRRPFSRVTSLALTVASLSMHLTSNAADDSNLAPSPSAAISMQATIKVTEGARLVPVSFDDQLLATARNTVNVPVFRKHSIFTHSGTQFLGYYSHDAKVVLAKRLLGSDKWQIVKTDLTGNIRDAHNMISLAVDGTGFLHMSWDHHNNPLNYRRSTNPGSLDTVVRSMTGQAENQLTYPEFHSLDGGDLLFLYRDGGSGRGNLAMNRYDSKSQVWQHLFSKLIDGENQRNAYWQACTDDRGTIHLSWVWRETWGVESNHDMCYAKSTDGGKTWTNSMGKPYVLPITAATAEYAARIPEKHELINQTSMTADGEGRPYIATYYRAPGTDIPQYHVIYHDGNRWIDSTASQLSKPFRLGGGGSKRLPLSRPQILSRVSGDKTKAYLVFRAEEFGNTISIASTEDISTGKWITRSLTTTSVGHWEPTYDHPLWREKGELHLFVQKAEQVDGEGVAEVPPEPVYVLEYKP